MRALEVGRVFRQLVPARASLTRLQPPSCQAAAQLRRHDADLEVRILEPAKG